MVNFIAIDFETTGLSANSGDKIVEIGALKFSLENGLTDEYCALVNPERPIPRLASQIHGISDAEVRDKNSIDLVWKQFLEWSDGILVLVAHNASFEKKFIDAIKSESVNRFLFLDTLYLSRKAFPRPQVQNHKLGTLCDYLDISLDNAHRALPDARATAKLLCRICDVEPSIKKDILQKASNSAFNQNLTQKKTRVPPVSKHNEEREKEAEKKKRAEQRARLKEEREKEGERKKREKQRARRKKRAEQRARLKEEHEREAEKGIRAAKREELAREQEEEANNIAQASGSLEESQYPKIARSRDSGGEFKKREPEADVKENSARSSHSDIRLLTAVLIIFIFFTFLFTLTNREKREASPALSGESVTLQPVAEPEDSYRFEPIEPVILSIDFELLSDEVRSVSRREWINQVAPAVSKGDIRTRAAEIALLGVNSQFDENASYLYDNRALSEMDSVKRWYVDEDNLFNMRFHNSSNYRISNLLIDHSYLSCDDAARSPDSWIRLQLTLDQLAQPVTTIFLQALLPFDYKVLKAISQGSGDGCVRISGAYWSRE